MLQANLMISKPHIFDYTRECLAIEVDTSLPGARVVRVLERLATAGRQPLYLVVDNGPEFASKALDQWTAKHGIGLRFIDSPVGNRRCHWHNCDHNRCLTTHDVTNGRGAPFLFQGAPRRPAHSCVA